MITNDVKACFENHPELNLIPEDKVSIIKKTLPKTTELKQIGQLSKIFLVPLILLSADWMNPIKR